MAVKKDTAETTDVVEPEPEPEGPKPTPAEEVELLKAQGNPDPERLAALKKQLYNG